MDTWSSIDNNATVSDAEDFVDDNKDDEDVGESGPDDDDSEHKTEEKKKKRKKNSKKEFKNMFNDNRHLFDMSCDCCEKTFKSLDEARVHYTSEHNKARGYIKSTSGSKLVHRSKVTEYVARHLNPDQFKYVFI